MLTKALVLTDGEADSLSRVLEEVKTKAYEESEMSLDDREALEGLISIFRGAEKGRQEKERTDTRAIPLSKRLVLGTILSKQTLQTITKAD